MGATKKDADVPASPVCWSIPWGLRSPRAMWTITRVDPGVWKTKTGYRVRVRAIDPNTGMRKEANRTLDGISLREAVKRQVEMREDLLQNVGPTQRARVGEFARSWIESKSAVVDEYTLTNYADALERHILPILGMRYYDTVGQLEVQGMVNRLLLKPKGNGDPYSRRSVEDFVDVFRNMTKDAIVHLGLDRDPTLRISFGDHTETQPKKKKATVAECMAVLAAMKRKRPSSYALLHTAACTGQRFCHVSALQWDDLDFEASLIRFRRKQVRGVVGPISRRKPAPKEIPLMPELAETLLAHKERMQKLGYPVGGEDWGFLGRTRKLKAPNSLIKAIESSSAEAHVSGHVPPHLMRYAFSDLMRRAGVDRVTRKAMIGHVTDEMQQHYSTVMLDERRDAMDAVAATMKDVKLGVVREGKGDGRGYDRGYRPEKEDAA